MAVLSNADRESVWAQTMRQVACSGVLKAELRAAIDAIDNWVDANATAFNTAIPQPARSALTSKQKAALLMYVVSRRFEVI